MRKKYPKHVNWLIYEKVDVDKYEVTDFLWEESYLLSSREVRFLKRLDGKTPPYSIMPSMDRESIDDLISELKECGLILEKGKNRIVEGIGSYDTVLFVPKINKQIAKVLNYILLFSFLPVFSIGIWMFLTVYQFESSSYDCWSLNLLAWILGLLSGMLLHECAHAVSAIAEGGRCFQIGLMYERFLPGMYAMIDTDYIKNKLKKAQVMGAGIESNLLYAGVLLVLGGVFHSFESLFIIAAFANLTLFLINITLIKSLDGSNILACLMGLDENFVDRCKTIVLRRKSQKAIMKSRGIFNGGATILFAVIILISQIMLPMLYILEILCIAGGLL